MIFDKSSEESNKSKGPEIASDKSSSRANFSQVSSQKNKSITGEKLKNKKPSKDKPDNFSDHEAQIEPKDSDASSREIKTKIFGGKNKESKEREAINLSDGEDHQASDSGEDDSEEKKGFYSKHS